MAVLEDHSPRNSYQAKSTEASQHRSIFRQSTWHYCSNTCSQLPPFCRFSAYAIARNRRRSPATLTIVSVANSRPDLELVWHLSTLICFAASIHTPITPHVRAMRAGRDLHTLRLPTYQMLRCDACSDESGYFSTCRVTRAVR